MKSNHISNFKTSGTLSSASKYTVGRILDYISFDDDITVLELGIGDGSITHRIIENLSEKSKFIGVELNTEFYQKIKDEIEDERVELVNDNAENLESILSDRNISQVDVIISTLPLSMINKEQLDSIFVQITAVMNESSVFIQALHTPHLYFRLRKYFSDIDTQYELRNIPPYLIFACKK